MIDRLWSGLARLVPAAVRGFAAEVYAGFVPVPGGIPEETDRFLDDLWRDAPLRVALATTLGAVAVQCSPPFLLGRPTVFTRLAPGERERLLARLMASDAYLGRLLFYGVKSMALVAVLRDPAVRRELGLDAGPPP